MDRRRFGALMVGTLAGTTAMRPAWAKKPSRDLEAWLRQFKAFPGTTSFRIDVGGNEVASDSAATPLFVASAIKTFIVCQYLRDIEAGRLSEDEQRPVNDGVRASGSPVLLDLTGTTPARSILEAMITHSDNTATDIALLRVGPDRVRSFIAAAGLRATRVPDSTRRFFSQAVLASGHSLGPPRPPLNEQVTLASSADDLVSYCQRALAGRFFARRTRRAPLLERGLADGAMVQGADFGKLHALTRCGKLDGPELRCVLVEGEVARPTHERRSVVRSLGRGAIRV